MFWIFTKVWCQPNTDIWWAKSKKWDCIHTIVGDNQLWKNSCAEIEWVQSSFLHRRKYFLIEWRFTVHKFAEGEKIKLKCTTQLIFMICIHSPRNTILLFSTMLITTPGRDTSWTTTTWRSTRWWWRRSWPGGRPSSRSWSGPSPGRGRSARRRSPAATSPAPPSPPAAPVTEIQEESRAVWSLVSRIRILRSYPSVNIYRIVIKVRRAK